MTKYFWRRKESISKNNTWKSFGTNENAIPDKKLSISDILPLLSAFVATVAAFILASGMAYRNGFYRFFNQESNIAPVGNQELIYTGFIDNLSNLFFIYISFAGVIILLVALKADKSNLKYNIYKKVVGILMWLSFPLLFTGFIGVIFMFRSAERDGIAAARTIAISSEHNENAISLIIRHTGSEKTIHRGFIISCSEKMCILYKPGIKKTNADENKSAGYTEIVPLENIDCFITGNTIDPINSSAIDNECAHKTS